jgi:hypothetical protein
MHTYTQAKKVPFFVKEANKSLSFWHGVATQTNNFGGLIQKFHKGIDNVHIIVHVI